MADISETPRSSSYAPNPVLTDEDRIFSDIIQNISHLPEGVRRVEYHVGEDSYGDPAVWFMIIADDDLKPSKQKLDDIARLSDEIRTAMLHSDSNRWPFVRIATE